MFVSTLKVYLQRIRHYSKKQFHEELPIDVQWINQNEYETLTAICDTFIPSLDISKLSENDIIASFARFCPDANKSDLFNFEDLLKHNAFLEMGAVNSQIPEAFAKAVELFILKKDKFELSLLLSLLNTSFGNFILSGICVPFNNLKLVDRVKVLQGFRNSPFQQLRAAYQTFRRLTSNLYLSNCERGKKNPTWSHLEFDDPLIISNKPTRNPGIAGTMKLFKLPNSMNHAVLEADVVVVGSGAGGGTIAYALVKAGLSVILLEKGGYFRSDTFKQWTEMEALSSTLDRGGLLASADGNIVILSGSCLGGGTTINWSASFKIPEDVRKEWLALNLLQFKDDGEYLMAYEEIVRLFNVNTCFSHRTCGDTQSDPEFIVNKNNEMLWKGAERLGLKPERIPRNVKNCVDCGNCCLGCPHDSKQSTLLALLEPLHEQIEAGRVRGKLQVLEYATVSRVIVEDGRAVGVDAVVREYIGEGFPIYNRQYTERTIKVKSKAVVVAAGAIQTPAILLRSGLHHPMIGKNLTLHPVLATSGIHSQNEFKSGMAQGVGMGVVVKGEKLARPEDKTWGVAVETPPVHPGIFGLSVPWDNPLSFRLSLLKYQKYSAFLAISRDHSKISNSVTINKDGEAVINYEVTPEDAKNLFHGLEQQLRLHYAAGASVICPSYEDPKMFVAAGDNTRSKEEFELYVKNVISKGYHANSTMVFSAHQMSSCRMSANQSDGPISPECETWECKNLFIGDASVFPTSLGVNPMITVESLALLTARNILKRFNKTLSTEELLGSSPSSW